MDSLTRLGTVLHRLLQVSKLATAHTFPHYSGLGTGRTLRYSSKSYTTTVNGWQTDILRHSNSDT